VPGGGGTAGGGGTPGGGGGSSGGGTSGGGSGLTCADLVPTFGDAVFVPLDTGTHSACAGATSHSNGQLALGVTAPGGGTDYLLYGPRGGERQGGIGPVVQAGHGPALHPAGGGWQATVHDQGASPPVTLRTWDATGHVLTDDASHQAEDTQPTADGGSVTVVRGTDAAATARLQWRDATGAVQREVDLGHPLALAIQNWATGHVLAITRDLQPTSKPWSARWYGADGAPLTDPKDVPGTPIQRSGTASPSLKLLVDGRVALHNGLFWASAFSDGDATAAPAPEWMAKHNEADLATIRGGRGYAALDPAKAGFEVLTADGQSCGTFSPPAPTAPPGETWRGTDFLWVGQDGTVIQRVQRTGGSLDNSNHCGFRAWTGLLR
jgi:hypothetical protein